MAGQELKDEITPGDLVVVLNFSGEGVIEPEGRRLGAGEAALVLRADGRGRVLRDKEGIHRYFVIRFLVEFVRQHCGEAGLADDLRKWVAGKRMKSFVRVETMPVALLGLRAAFLEPPVAGSAQALWYQCKAMEILTHLIFEYPAGESGDAAQRQIRERCGEVLRLLKRDMENPPSLEMLAEHLGCSPFTLSRLFVAETGQSIPAALRAIRMEAAAQLLGEGRCSVTEVAMRVGYSSLGSFMKAFADRYGCSPGQFAKHGPPRKAAPRS
ncbi:MAG: hypothetical protein Fur0032_12860 [Terrimicrobiaceae bacterium]